MTRRIVVAATGVPFTGEGSTCGYALFRALQQDRPEITFLSLLDERDEAWAQLTCGPQCMNPDELASAHYSLIGDGGLQDELEAKLAALVPDVIVAIGNDAATLLTTVQNTARIVLYAGESLLHTARQEINLSRLNDQINQNQPLQPGPEIWTAQAISAAELIIAPSEISLALLLRLYSSSSGKIHPQAITSASWVAREAARWQGLKRQWDERDIDLLLVSNRWKPAGKSYELARHLAQEFRRHKVVVVGEPDRPFPTAETTGLLSDRETYMELLGRARVLVCPATFQLSSTPLFEAAAMGVNVVASRGCGNWQVCHPDLIVDRPTVAGFRDRVSMALESQLESMLNPDDDAQSYETLVEILEFV